MAVTDRTSRIIKRFLSNRFSPFIEEKVQRWIIDDHHVYEKEQVSLEYWDSLKVKPDRATYSALNRIKQRIGLPLERRRKWHPHVGISSIAAVTAIFLLLAGGYFYHHSTQEKWIEIAVANGQTKHLFLPDSSEVWINAGTTLKYPSSFSRQQRSIQLAGEAYFSVRRNEQQPFIVSTPNLSVKVLGTQFNIKAYPDDSQTSATLISGKIEVNVGPDNLLPDHAVIPEPQILKPNEQLDFDHETARVRVSKISTEAVTGWINGQLIFTNATLDGIMRTIERRFNVAVHSSVPLSDELYTAKFTKNHTLKDVLDLLQEIAPYRIEQKENNVFISPE